MSMRALAALVLGWLFLLGCGSSKTAITACSGAQLKVTTQKNGGGQSSYTAVSVFNTGKRACTLTGFPSVLLYAGTHRVAADERRVAGDLTATTRVATVTLTPEPRSAQRQPSPRNAFFMIEIGNVCSGPFLSVLEVLAPAPPTPVVKTGAVCVSRHMSPFLTVSQYQPDPTGQ